MPRRQARNKILRLRSSSAALLSIEPDMDDLSIFLTALLRRSNDVMAGLDPAIHVLPPPPPPSAITGQERDCALEGLSCRGRRNTSLAGSEAPGRDRRRVFPYTP